MIKYFLRWEGKDTDKKYIKGEIEVKSRIAESLLQQLIILKAGNLILKEVKEGVSK